LEMKRQSHGDPALVGAKSESWLALTQPPPSRQTHKA
jgi:hypothetical protein